MSKDIKSILADLYALDPSLKEHEEALVKVVTELLALKPDTKFDPHFAARLRKQILAGQETPSEQGPLRQYVLTMKKMIITLTGSAVVVALALILLIVGTPHQLGLPENKNSAEQSTKSLSTGAVSRLAANAFGTLSDGGAAGDTATLPAQAPAPDAQTPAASQAMPMRGAMGVSSAAPMMLSAPVQGKASSPTISEKMIVRPVYNVSLVYTGDPITLSETELDVLHRVKPTAGRTDLVGAVAGATVGGVNVESFANAGLTSFEVSQSADKGYTVSVNLLDGTVNINQNWQTWPAMANAAPLSEKDMLSDEELTTIANNFLQTHGVDLSHYGAPEVNKDWMPIRPMAEDAKTSMPAFVPDTMTVLFPEKLNNEYVYDQGGTKTGIQVTVSLREKAVQSVWGIQTQNYEASSYEAETDASRIIKIAEQGGVYGNYGEAGSNATQVELGTPERVYTLVWQTKDNTQQELLVPALRFPVINNPSSSYFYQKNIIVPLVKELLTPPTPNPGPINYMMKGAAGIGTATPGQTVAPSIAPAPEKK